MPEIFQRNRNERICERNAKTENQKTELHVFGSVMMEHSRMWWWNKTCNWPQEQHQQSCCCWETSFVHQRGKERWCLPDDCSWDPHSWYWSVMRQWLALTRSCGWASSMTVAVRREHLGCCLWIDWSCNPSSSIHATLPSFPTLRRVHSWWEISTAMRMEGLESCLTARYFWDPDAWEISLRSSELILRACYQREPEFWEKEALQLPMELIHPMHSGSAEESQGSSDWKSFPGCDLRLGSDHKTKSADCAGYQETKEARLVQSRQRCSVVSDTSIFPRQVSGFLKALDFRLIVAPGRESLLSWIHPAPWCIPLHWKTRKDQCRLQTPKWRRNNRQANRPWSSSLMPELRNPACAEEAAAAVLVLDNNTQKGIQEEGVGASTKPHHWAPPHGRIVVSWKEVALPSWWWWFARHRINPSSPNNRIALPARTTTTTTTTSEILFSCEQKIEVRKKTCVELQERLSDAQHKTVKDSLHWLFVCMPSTTEEQFRWRIQKPRQEDERTILECSLKKLLL